MPSTTVNARHTSAARPASAMSGWWVLGLGWLLPGMGYFITRRWIRGGLVLASIVVMFGVGLGLGGKVFPANTGDILQMLGFVGDLCAGALYFIVRAVGGGAGNMFSVLGDYGSQFLIAAGLLNLLAASDARDIFLGKKQ